MTKIFIALLVVMLIVGTLAPVAFAKGNSNVEAQEERKAERDADKAERDAAKQERADERAQIKAEFKERMLERAQIRTATKEQLRTQRELVAGYKLELKTMRQYFETLTDEEIAAMTEEERVAYGAEVDALKTQIKDTHKYNLEIIRAAHAEIKEIFPGVRAGNQPPTEEEVVDAQEIIEDL